MSLVPVMLHGEHVVALVVGGGPVAARRALALVECGARVRVVAPELDARLEESAANDPRLVLEERAYEPGDEAGATLVIAATDDRAVNRLVSDRARAIGLLVNVVDAPEEGSFVTPAVHREGDLVVAVSAGGVPSAAVRVRDTIAGRFDARYAAALTTLRALRERMLAAGDSVRWRQATAELTGGDFVACVEDGTLDERVRRWE